MTALPRKAWLASVFLWALLAPAATAAGPAGTQAALEREMLRAGASSGALALDIGSGQLVYSREAHTGRIPASVNKLNTAAALLRRFGPGATLTTQVLAQQAPDRGVVRGNVYLRGGGDPTFGHAQARRLATAIAATGVKRVRGRVIGDESLFDDRRGPPSSGLALSSWVGPLSALSFGRG